MGEIMKQIEQQDIDMSMMKETIMQVDNRIEHVESVKGLPNYRPMDDMNHRISAIEETLSRTPHRLESNSWDELMGEVKEVENRLLNNVEEFLQEEKSKMRESTWPLYLEMHSWIDSEMKKYKPRERTPQRSNFSPQREFEP